MERFTWRPMPVTFVLYGGTCRSNGMATQSLAIQNGHGNISVTRMHRCSCRRASKVPEICGSAGSSRLQGANFSAVFLLRFLVLPNLGLQQLQCRCYDNVYWEPCEHLNEKKDCNFMDCVNQHSMCFQCLCTQFCSFPGLNSQVQVPGSRCPDISAIAQGNFLVSWQHDKTTRL